MVWKLPSDCMLSSQSIALLPPSGGLSNQNAHVLRSWPLDCTVSSVCSSVSTQFCSRRRSRIQ